MAEDTSAPDDIYKTKDIDESSKWHLLTHALETAPTVNTAHNLRSLPSVPFVHFGVPVPADVDAAALYAIYIILYAAARASVEKYIAANFGELSLHSMEGGDLPISYNLGMTASCMSICPRRAEERMVQRSDGSDVDKVALNGTMLGGTLMVKDEEVWDVMRHDVRKVEQVLEAAGLPKGRGYDVFEEGEMDVGRWPELRGALRPASGLL